MSTVTYKLDLTPSQAFTALRQARRSGCIRPAYRPTLVRTWDLMHSLRYMRHAWLSINRGHTEHPLPIRDALAAHHRAMREIVGAKEWRRRLKICYGL